MSDRIKPHQSLKENPTLIAACLVYGEKMQLESAQGFHELLETVVLSIFGQSCATQNQEGFTLTIVGSKATAYFLNQHM